MSELKPWDEAKLNKSQNIELKPWEEAARNKTTSVKDYLLKVSQDIGEVGKGFSPEGADTAVRSIVGAVESDIPKIKKFFAPGRPEEDYISQLSKMETTKLAGAMVRPILHPLKSLGEGKLASTALAWAPIASKVLGLFPKPIPASVAKARGTVGLQKISEGLGGKKISPSSVEDLAIKEVREQVTPTMGETAARLNLQAAEKVGDVFQGLKKAKKTIYEAEGVSGNKPINLRDNLKEARNKVVDFDKTAVGENKKLSQIANDMLNDMTEKMGDKNAITFDNLKSIRDQFRSVGDKYLKDTMHGEVATPESRLFHGIADMLNDSKLKDAAIARASKRYAELSKAEDMLARIYRLKDPMTGEISFERAGLRRSQDLGNMKYQNDLEAISDMLAKDPATKELANFLPDVKAADIAIDMRRGTLSGEGGSLGMTALKSLKKPGQGAGRLNLIARGLDAGLLSPKNLGSYIPASKMPLIGAPLTHFRGLQGISPLRELNKLQYPIGGLSRILSEDVRKKKKEK